MNGKLNFAEEKAPELVCNGISPGTESAEEGHGPKKSVRPGLYLRLDSKEDPRYRKAMQYIAIFDGVSDLYLTFRDSGKLLRAPAKYRVDVNQPLVNALKELLGDENVAYYGVKR